jgi:predicted RNase H-like nuclease (RuvC/YqgF family)
MAKKSISDLLREQVNKPIDSEVVSQEPTPVVSDSESTATEVTSQTQEVSTTGSSQSTPETPNPLEKTVTELNTSLEKVTQRGNKLQAQVSSLEGELNSQKDLVKQLSNELQQAQGVKSELETQKHLVNKLYAELQEIQQKYQAEVTSAITRQETTSIVPIKMFTRFVAKSAPPTKLTDEDIGWFD